MPILRERPDVVAGRAARTDDRPAGLIGRTIASPVGALTLVSSSVGLVAVLWADDRPGRVPLGAAPNDESNEHIESAETQLADYFAGRLRRFEMSLDLRGTDFQRAVWAELALIPFGATRTYGDIAAILAKPTASRAVGAAVGRNPISIIIPCHRIIGAGGALTGFAGGIEVKRRLLALEGMDSGRLL